MKKIIAIVLGSVGLMNAAFAATSTTTRLDTTLVAGWNEIAPLARQINLAQTGTLTAIASRAGFVKQNFDFTVSSNVALGVNDAAATNRFGVIAGSNKGYNVFTGSSVGGSVSSCGAQIPNDSTNPNLGAGQVTTGNLVLANANGCGRQ